VREWFKEHFAYVITLADAAKERSPVFPFTPHLLHWNLRDPTLATGTTVVARPFRAPAPHRRIGIVWRRSYPDEAGIRALAEFIRARAPRAVRRVTA